MDEYKPNLNPFRGISKEWLKIILNAIMTDRGKVHLGGQPYSQRTEIIWMIREEIDNKNKKLTED